MPEVVLTRRYEFSASHRLHSELLTEEENRRTFGKCNNPFGHGHNYLLEVSLRGQVDAESGLAADIRRLDSLVKSEVLDRFHMRNLNADAGDFRSLVPTSENLVVVVEKRLRSAWPEWFPGGPALERIRVQETKRNAFEVRARVPAASPGERGAECSEPVRTER